MRQKIAVDKRRPDGRGAEEIRPIEIEVGVNPRAHGSGLFTRGQTQILSSLTLGTAKEGQRIDDLSLEEERRYMHHYNFPPYSVGETGFMRGPKRRDIGHGALAQRALEAVIPAAEDFPYTIRIVSETLESNGSSSMGSVCGSTLSLMDAGVPIKAPVSGIAMGLVKEGDDYVILTDIQGAEDHLGDMDFKVAGSRNGITALQMDIKITGVTQQIMRDALEQAKRAREFILDKMLEVIPESRSELAENAPRITTIKIDQEKIGMVIGKGGETIRGLESDYEVQIDIEEDGTILIYATEGTKAKAAIAAIEALTKEPEVGDTFTGKVVKTTQFGAFVELKKGTDGLLHVSNVGPGRVAHIEDVMSRGDVVDVVVQEVDKARGRIGLKLVAKHENGGLVQPEELIERAKDAPPRPPEEERPRAATAAAAAAAVAAAAARAATTSNRALGRALERPSTGVQFTLSGRIGPESAHPRLGSLPMTFRRAEPVSLPTISPLRGLVEVTRLLRAREDLPALLDAVARTIGESLGYRTVAVNLYRPAWDDFEVTTVHGNEEARAVLLGNTRDAATTGGAARRPLRAARRLRRAERRRSTGTRSARATCRRAGGACHPDAWDPEDALFVPMRDQRGHLLGIISVDEPRQRPPARPTRTSTSSSSLADHAALAVEAAREAAESARHQRALEELLAVSSRITGETSNAEILRRVCSGIRDALDFRQRLRRTRRSGDRRARAAGRGGLAARGDASSAQLADASPRSSRCSTTMFLREGCYLLTHDAGARAARAARSTSTRRS